METPVTIDVSTLDHAHRQAMEDVLGRALEGNQRLTIQISSVAEPNGEKGEPTALELVKHFYDGMSEQEIEEIDACIKTRANLYRHFP